MSALWENVGNGSELQKQPWVFCNWERLQILRPATKNLGKELAVVMLGMIQWCHTKVLLEKYESLFVTTVRVLCILMNEILQVSTILLILTQLTSTCLLIRWIAKSLCNFLNVQIFASISFSFLKDFCVQFRFILHIIINTIDCATEENIQNMQGKTKQINNK